MPKEAGEIYKQASGGVVAIRTRRGDGSGVVVGDNEVVTNCHVVDDGGPIGVGLVDPNGQWEPVPAQLVAAVEGDLCLLRTKGLSATPLQIGSAKNLNPGDTVYAMGAPLRLPLTFSGGFVSQLRGGPELPDTIQTDAAISGGSSGGGLFDCEGCLVGITTSSKEGGQNLNFACPVDWVNILRERAPKEVQLRAALSKILTEESPSPDLLRSLVAGIVGLCDSPVDKAGIFGRIAREESRAGNKAIAGDLATRIAGLPQPENPDGKDRIMLEAAWSWACAGNFTESLNLADKIGDDVIRSIAYAVISAQRARDGDAAAARGIFEKASPFFDADKLGHHIWIVAWAMAEMGDLDGAFQCAQKIADSEDARANIGFFIKLVFPALTNIASAMARQGISIGAAALFEFVHKKLDDLQKGSPEDRGAIRALALGEIAWDEAESGYREAAWESVKTAMTIIGEGGLEPMAYKYQIRALAQVARAAAKIGDVPLARHAISQIPVLGDELAIALAYYAIAMGVTGIGG